MIFITRHSERSASMSVRTDLDIACVHIEQLESNAKCSTKHWLAFATHVVAMARNVQGPDWPTPNEALRERMPARLQLKRLCRGFVHQRARGSDDAVAQRGARRDHAAETVPASGQGRNLAEWTLGRCHSCG